MSDLLPVPIEKFSPQSSADDWQLNLQLFGPFEGVNSPSSRLDALVCAHVNRMHMRGFSAVYKSRWWDYRRLSPGQSMMLFNREYLKAMRRGARNFVESRGPQRTATGRIMTAGEVASFNRLYGAIFTKQTEDMIWERESQYIVGIFKAMTAADLFGIPYDHYCRTAIEQALERNWDRVPQPWHLYNDRLAAETINAWEEQLTRKLTLARHPMFALENYCELQVQDDYRTWVIEQIKRREGNHAIPLSVVLYQTPQLPVDFAAPFFSEPVMRQARSLGS